MSKNGKTRSIRGEVVDFDLMRVKQKMENREKPDSVEMREKYIDIRRRRNPRRNVSDLVNEQRKNEQDAREKIRQSKEARQKAEANAEAEEGVVTVDDIVNTTPTPTATVTPTKRTSKKKIVKRTTKKTEE